LEKDVEKTTNYAGKFLGNAKKMHPLCETTLEYEEISTVTKLMIKPLAGTKQQRN